MKLNKIRNLLPMLLILVLQTQLHADYNVIEYKAGQKKGIFYPEGKRNSPIIFFLRGDYDSKYTNSYDNLLKFIAKQGYTVMFTASNSRAGENFKDVKSFMEERKSFLDTSRIGIIGHSVGGGVAFHTLLEAQKKPREWGKNGRFIFSIEPHTTYKVTANQMRHLPSNTNVVIQQYGKPSPSGTSAKIPLTQYYLLDSIPNKNKDYQIIDNNLHIPHSYPTGEVANKPYLINPLKALMKYTFTGSNNETLRKQALEIDGISTDSPYAQYNASQLNAYNCDPKDPNQSEYEYRLKYPIDHCSNYMPPSKAFSQHEFKTSNHIEKRKSHYYILSASEGDTISTSLQSTNGDSNVYVGVGHRPTSGRNDCHSTHSGTKSDGCTVTVNQDANVYVRVYGRKATDYNLNVTKKTNKYVYDHEFKTSNQIEKRKSHYYLLSASEGDTISTSLQSTNGDSNVYVGVGYRPTSGRNNCHSTHSGTKSDSCDVTLDKDATVYVRVYGRKATNYNLEVTKSE